MALKLLKELKAGRGLPLKNLGNLISVTIPQMIYFSGWWFQTWLDYFPFHIWDVVPTPLTNSIIFQDGYCTTNQQ